MSDDPTRRLKYWGAILPVADTVLWCGRNVPVTFDMQDSVSELEILALAANGPPAEVRLQHPDQRDYLETFYRMCRALHSIDGEVVEESEQERMTLFGTWLDPIMWELRDAYTRAKTTILLEEQKVAADPLPEAPSGAENGAASGAGISTAALPRRRQRTLTSI